MTKKITSLVLALVMLFSLTTIIASAETTDPAPGKYVIYSMSEGDTTIDRDMLVEIEMDGISLTINDDGTAVMDMGDGDPTTLAWGNGEIGDGEDAYPLTVDGDFISFGDDSMKFTFCAEGAADTAAPAKDEKDEKEDKKEDKKDGDLPAEDPAVHEEVTIEEFVALDQDDISLKFKEVAFDDDPKWGYYEFSYVLKNGTDKNLSVTTDNVSVNGIMTVSGGIWESVDAGKNAKNNFRLYLSDLEKIGVGTIRDLTFRIEVKDSDSYDEILTTDFMTIETSAFGTATTAVDTEGKELYNDNGVKIIAKETVLPDDYNLGKVPFVIENTNDYVIYVSDSNTYINGWDATTSLYKEVAPGKTAICTMNIYSEADDLDIETYEDITELESDLNIYENDDWKKIDTVSIELAIGK
ncbi:MAG: hypothetical protein Q4C42_04250 [Clostridia bacterium]|nr:hypothetical protein [Clostridia bacterium]